MAYKVMIEGEVAYPIYSLLMTFDMVKNGVLNHKTINHHKMFKEIPLKSKIAEWTNKVKGWQVEKSRAYNLTQDVNLLRYETWNLTWFQHETFDVGQTDQEALESFRKYVKRHRYDDKYWGGDKLINSVCLMGAQDRYRWRGAEPNGESSSDSKPPCRCRFCKEQGVIRIAH